LKPSYWEEFSEIPKAPFEYLTASGDKQRKTFLERIEQQKLESVKSLNYVTFKASEKGTSKPFLFGISLNKLIEVLTVQEHRLYETMKNIRFREYDDIANDYYEVFGENCIRPEAEVNPKDAFRKCFFCGYQNLISPDGLLLKIFERISLPLIMIVKNYANDYSNKIGEDIIEQSIGDNVEKIINSISQIITGVECVDILLRSIDILNYWLTNYLHHWNNNMFEFATKIIEQIQILKRIKSTNASTISDSTVFLSKISELSEACTGLSETVKKYNKRFVAKSTALRKKVSMKEFLQFTSMGIDGGANSSNRFSIKGMLASFVNSTHSDDLLQNLRTGNTRRSSNPYDDLTLDSEVNADTLAKDEEDSNEDFFYFYKTVYTDSSKCPRPIVPHNVFSATLNWSDIDPIELARQFTIVDYYLFSEISQSEIMTYAALSLKNSKKKNGEIDFNMCGCNYQTQFFKMNCPKLCKYLDLIHGRTNWLMCDLLDKPKIKDRADLVVKIKKLITELFKLQNYGCAHAIATMFSHPAISENLRYTLYDSEKKLKAGFNMTFTSMLKLLGEPKHVSTLQDVTGNNSGTFSTDEIALVRPESESYTKKRRESMNMIRFVATSGKNDYTTMSGTENTEDDVSVISENPSLFIERKHAATISDSPLIHMPTPSLIHFKSKYDSYHGFNPTTSDLELMVIVDSRYQHYNDLFDGVKSPCIPILDAHIREIMYIQNHYSEYLQNEELNYIYDAEDCFKSGLLLRWEKFEQLAIAMHRLERCISDFPLQPVFQIQMMIQKQQRESSLLHNTNNMNVENFVKIARIREPTGFARKDLL